MNATKINYSQICEEKICDLKSQIAAMKTNESISKNTRGTQLYKLGRERRVLHLINSLITQVGDKVKFDKDDMDTFVLITTLASERTARSSIEVKEGDSILELLQKYDGVKDIQKKLKKACEDAGLMIDGPTIVKA